MYLNAMGTALPPRRYTKSDCWQAFSQSDWFERLDPRSRAVVKTVLERDNGIEERRLALETLEEVFAIDPDTLQRRFAQHAPLLAAEAGRQALERAGLAAAAIDAVIVSTCTGYLCPGLSGYVVERLGLRPDVLASIWWDRAAPRRCRTGSWRRGCSAPGAASMCCRSASKSAAPRCIWTTIPAC